MIIREHSHSGLNRRGIALMLTALMIPCFFGFFALTIDVGQAMETQKLLQVTADSIAFGVLNRVDRGFTPSEQLAHANSVRAFNHPESNAIAWNRGTVDTINNPPRSGQFAGDSNYYEVIVSAPVRGLFAGILNWGGQSIVTARAVGGLELGDGAESIIAIDPCAGSAGSKTPGLKMTQKAELNVDGAILINSGRGGYDQAGKPVNLPLPGYSIDINKNNIRARTVYVRGGVDKRDLKGFRNYTKSKSSPLRANQRRVLQDPLASLPVPSPHFPPVPVLSSDR